jgi:hypothetical protein
MMEQGDVGAGFYGTVVLPYTLQACLWLNGIERALESKFMCRSRVNGGYIGGVFLMA